MPTMVEEKKVPATSLKDALSKLDNGSGKKPLPEQELLRVMRDQVEFLNAVEKKGFKQKIPKHELEDLKSRLETVKRITLAVKDLALSRAKLKQPEIVSWQNEILSMFKDHRSEFGKLTNSRKH